MQNTGIVQSVNGKYAQVSFSRLSSCSGECSSCGFCKEKKHIATVFNDCGAKEGDVVTVETPSGRILFAAFIVFILPMITALSVGAAMCGIGVSGLYSALAGTAVFALLYIILHLSNKLIQKSQYFIGHITTLSYRHDSKNVLK